MSRLNRMTSGNDVSGSQELRIAHGLQSVLVAVLIITGMAADARATSAQGGAGAETALADSLLMIARGFGAAFGDLSWERMNGFLADDFHYYRMGERIASSRTEFEHIFRQFILPTTRGYSAELPGEEAARDEERADVAIFGRTAAVISFEFAGAETKVSGEVESIAGAVSYVLARRDGEWKIVHMHESGAPHEVDHGGGT